MRFLIRMSICTHIYLSHITPSLAQGTVLVATDPSLLNPCCFQGPCLTLHRASFHLPMHSIPVFTEGNQSEIKQSRLISIVKGRGEYAIRQPGCLAALRATGEENQREKCMHQRVSSQGPLISLYRVCLEKIRGDSHLKSGTKVRPQLTPPSPQAGHTCQETKAPESCQADGPMAVFLTTWPRKHCRCLVIGNRARFSISKVLGFIHKEVNYLLYHLYFERGERV